MLANLPDVFDTQGPADTPFEGGTFELALNVPEQYPLQAPSVRFRTKNLPPQHTLQGVPRLVRPTEQQVFFSNAVQSLVACATALDVLWNVPCTRRCNLAHMPV